ncbi:MAG: alpha/beta hydrolase [Pseudomonadales bacterium]|nr:alpha/beta hydrolase [Pseudomonadales bacterium]
MTNQQVLYAKGLLPEGIRSRIITGVNGLAMHILEAGYETPGRPTLVLLHGFPEIAFSWRFQLSAFADAGYHVIAPDQRGYGLTTGWPQGYHIDLTAWRMDQLAGDIVALLDALEIPRAACVIGHDFGSPVAAWASLLHPARFGGTVLMSAPFGGPPPGNQHQDQGTTRSKKPGLNQQLSQLKPPRIHYQWYYSTPTAEADLLSCQQGLTRFFLQYYQVKAAGWPENQPFPLTGRSAGEMAKLPHYYVMPLAETMPQTVARMTNDCPSPVPDWLTDEVAGTYASIYKASGFQGGLNWYRAAISGASASALSVWADRQINIPCCFIAGAEDWGIHQTPGALSRMETHACSAFQGTCLVSGAGHWVQQEQPEAVNQRILSFLTEVQDFHAQVIPD